MLKSHDLKFERRLIMERFIVTYRLSYIGDEARQIAEALRIEQTIEFPYELVTDSYIKNEITGHLESLVADGDTSIARISYSVETTAFEATQFLNVVFGNSSLIPGIWVEDIEVTPALLSVFKGPRFGLAELRKLVNVPKRPMLQAVIKPMGTSPESLARMCEAYTLGGADVIKDDHGITNQSFSTFENRVKCCAAAVQEANAKCGGHTLYAANVSADGHTVLERAYRAKELGATALMVAPALIGYGWLHALATDENLKLPIISHPAFMGGFALPGMSGINQEIYMGVLPRLFGADMSIFVSYGGRFTFTAEACQRIHHMLTKPYEEVKASCPGPGGGVTAERLPVLADIYGNDVMYLVGGDMFRRGSDLQDNMQCFIELLHNLTKEV